MPERKFVCPWWLGFVLIHPLRRLYHNPERLLGPYLKPGMCVLEPGAGLGYFTLPMARMVGASGKVVALDVQTKMLDTLLNRARKAGVPSVIETRLVDGEHLPLEDMAEKADFALAFAMVHEVPDARALFADLRAAQKPGARLLFAEPRGHVSQADFDRSLAIAGEVGYEIERAVEVSHCRAALLRVSSR